MMNKFSPAATLKRIFGSGKITFLCVMFTLAALAAFGEVVNSHMSFDTVEFLGMEFQLGEFIGYEGVELLNLIADAIFVIGIIGLLPKVAVTVALWMIKNGAQESAKGTKNALIGLNIIKINYLYQAIVQALGMIAVGAVGIFVLYLTYALTANTTIVFIELILLALVLGYFYFLYKYYTNFTTMLIGCTQTLRTNANLVVKSSMVIVLNYIIAIFLIISSFGNGVWALVAGVCDALCIIFVNRCFGSYAEFCGYAQPAESKAFMEQLQNDPALERTALALGVGRAYATDPLEQKPPALQYFKNMMFGLTVAYVDDPTPYTPSTAAAGQPADCAQAEQASAPAKNKPARYQRAADLTDPLPVRYLSLFAEDLQTVDGRYELLGSCAIPPQKSLVEPCGIQLLLDGVSEKKILRVELENRSPETVKQIRFKVIPKTNESSSLGVCADVTLPIEIASGARGGAAYGLILPDETTCGTVAVTFVDFADGMFRDKEGEAHRFSSQEKMDFDTLLYLSAMNNR